MRANTDTLKNSFVFRTISKWNTLPVSIIHAGSVNAFNSRLTSTPQRAASPPFPSWSTWTLGNYYPDPDLHRGGSRIWKRRGAGGSGARPKIFLPISGDFSKYLAQKELGVRPPAPPPSGSAPAPGLSSWTSINNRNSNVSTRVFHNKRNDDRNTSTSVWVHQSFCKHAAITSRKALKLPYRGRICTT